MRLRHAALGFALVCACGLAACAKPLPADRQDYVGVWTGTAGADEMRLAIAPDGQLEYERRHPGSEKRISAPIQAFEGDDIVAGVMGMKTRFDVTEAPRQVDGRWTMTVDGVRLTRQ